MKSINKNFVLWLELQMIKRGWHNHDGQMQPHPVAVKNHEEYFSSAGQTVAVQHPSSSQKIPSPQKLDLPALDKFKQDNLHDVAAAALKRAGVQRSKVSASGVRGFAPLVQAGFALLSRPNSNNIVMTYDGTPNPEKWDHAIEAVKQAGFKVEKWGNDVKISPDYSSLSSEQRKELIDYTQSGLNYAKGRYSELHGLANEAKRQGNIQRSKNKEKEAIPFGDIIAKTEERLKMLMASE